MAAASATGPIYTKNGVPLPSLLPIKSESSTFKIDDELEKTLGAQALEGPCEFRDDLVGTKAFGTALYKSGDTVLHKLIRRNCLDTAIALIRNWKSASIVEKSDGTFLLKEVYLTRKNYDGETPMMLLEAKDQTDVNVIRTIFELKEALGLRTEPVRDIPSVGGAGAKAARKNNRKSRKNNRKNSRKNNRKTRKTTRKNNRRNYRK